MNMETLVTAGAAAVTVGLVNGGGFLLAIKLWVGRVNDDLTGHARALDELERKTNDMAGQLAVMMKLDEKMQALHRRLDEHTRDESEQRAEIARSLGELTASVNIALGVLHTSPRSNQ